MPLLKSPLTLGHIAVSSALGFLNFRQIGGDWRGVPRMSRRGTSGLSPERPWYSPSHMAEPCKGRARPHVARHDK